MIVFRCKRRSETGLSIASWRRRE